MRPIDFSTDGLERLRLPVRVLFNLPQGAKAFAAPAGDSTVVTLSDGVRFAVRAPVAGKTVSVEAGGELLLPKEWVAADAGGVSLSLPFSWKAVFEAGAVIASNAVRLSDEESVFFPFTPKLEEGVEAGGRVRGFKFVFVPANSRVAFGKTRFTAAEGISRAAGGETLALEFTLPEDSFIRLPSGAEVSSTGGVTDAVFKSCFNGLEVYSKSSRRKVLGLPSSAALWASPSSVREEPPAVFVDVPAGGKLKVFACSPQDADARRVTFYPSSETTFILPLDADTDLANPRQVAFPTPACRELSAQGASLPATAATLIEFAGKSTPVVNAQLDEAVFKRTRKQQVRVPAGEPVVFVVCGEGQPPGVASVQQKALDAYNPVLKFSETPLKFSFDESLQNFKSSGYTLLQAKSFGVTNLWSGNLLATFVNGEAGPDAALSNFISKGDILWNVDGKEHAAEMALEAGRGEYVLDVTAVLTPASGFVNPATGCVAKSTPQDKPVKGNLVVVAKDSKDASRKFVSKLSVEIEVKAAPGGCKANRDSFKRASMSGLYATQAQLVKENVPLDTTPAADVKVEGAVRGRVGNSLVFKAKDDGKTFYVINNREEKVTLSAFWVQGNEAADCEAKVLPAVGEPEVYWVNLLREDGVELPKGAVAKIVCTPLKEATPAYLVIYGKGEKTGDVGVTRMQVQFVDARPEKNSPAAKLFQSNPLGRLSNAAGRQAIMDVFDSEASAAAASASSPATSSASSASSPATPASATSPSTPASAPATPPSTPALSTSTSSTPSSASTASAPSTPSINLQSATSQASQSPSGKLQSPRGKLLFATQDVPVVSETSAGVPQGTEIVPVNPAGELGGVSWAACEEFFCDEDEVLSAFKTFSESIVSTIRERLTLGGEESLDLNSAIARLHESSGDVLLKSHIIQKAGPGAVKKNDVEKELGGVGGAQFFLDEFEDISGCGVWVASYRVQLPSAAASQFSSVDDFLAKTEVHVSVAAADTCVESLNNLPLLMGKPRQVTAVTSDGGVALVKGGVALTDPAIVVGRNSVSLGREMLSVKTNTVEMFSNFKQAVSSDGLGAKALAMLDSPAVIQTGPYAMAESDSSVRDRDAALGVFKALYGEELTGQGWQAHAIKTAYAYEDGVFCRKQALPAIPKIVGLTGGVGVALTAIGHGLSLSSMGWLALLGEPLAFYGQNLASSAVGSVPSCLFGFGVYSGSGSTCNGYRACVENVVFSSFIPAGGAGVTATAGVAFRKTLLDSVRSSFSASALKASALGASAPKFILSGRAGAVTGGLVNLAGSVGAGALERGQEDAQFKAPYALAATRGGASAYDALLGGGVAEKFNAAMAAAGISDVIFEVDNLYDFAVNNPVQLKAVLMSKGVTGNVDVKARAVYDALAPLRNAYRAELKTQLTALIADDVEVVLKGDSERLGSGGAKFGRDAVVAEVLKKVESGSALQAAIEATVEESDRASLFVGDLDVPAAVTSASSATDANIKPLVRKFNSLRLKMSTWNVDLGRKAKLGAVGGVGNALKLIAALSFDVDFRPVQAADRFSEGGELVAEDASANKIVLLNYRGEGDVPSVYRYCDAVGKDGKCESEPIQFNGDNERKACKAVKDGEKKACVWWGKRADGKHYYLVASFDEPEESKGGAAVASGGGVKGGSSIVPISGSPGQKPVAPPAPQEEGEPAAADAGAKLAAESFFTTVFDPEDQTPLEFKFVKVTPEKFGGTDGK